MRRVVLVHWNEAEAAGRLGALASAGFEAERLERTGGRGLKALRERPPDAFVIDLDRRPSQGRDLGLWLRRQKPTRRVPLVFVGGPLEKVAAVKKLLPDAVFGSWREVAALVKRAIRHPPSEPVVRDVFAGYSGTPLAKKLGVEPGSTVALLGAPGDFASVVAELPEGVRIRRQARGRVDLALLCVRSRDELRRRFPPAGRALVERGRLWVAWPKKASGVVTDLTQQHVREHGLAAGWVDFKICAIDATWSGLCFVRRRGS